MCWAWAAFPECDFTDSHFSSCTSPFWTFPRERLQSSKGCLAWLSSTTTLEYKIPNPPLSPFLFNKPKSKELQKFDWQFRSNNHHSSRSCSVSLRPCGLCFSLTSHLTDGERVSQGEHVSQRHNTSWTSYLRLCPSLPPSIKDPSNGRCRFFHHVIFFFPAAKSKRI